ncbi:unnamed protein product [Prunus brigantina]
MMTIFKSHGLWNLVEKGVKTFDSEKKKAEGSSEDDVDGKMAVVLMQDTKALGIIQNVVSDQIFPRISNVESAKMVLSPFLTTKMSKVEFQQCLLLITQGLGQNPSTTHALEMGGFVVEMKRRTFGEAHGSKEDPRLKRGSKVPKRIQCNSEHGLVFDELRTLDVRSVKLQNLRREFEYARMRDDETLSGYLTRLNELINLMKTFGEVLSNARLVQKVLISLSKPYDPICLVIEDMKNIETVELQEILAILKSQE